MFTSNSLSLAYIVLPLILVLTAIYYSILFHPLARVPGPRLAAFSSIWYANQVRNGRAAHLGRTLHKKYGPMVRVAPNEVWFDSKAAFKTIYSSGSGYEKSDFYLATALAKPNFDWLLRPQSADILDLLSERDVKRYRLQRRLIGPVYRPDNVAKFEPALDAVIARVIDTLKRLEGKEIDLKQWMHIIAVECLGAVVLSWSPGMLKQGTDMGTSTHAYLGWRRKSVFGLFPLMAKMEFLYPSLARHFGNIWGVTFASSPGYRAFFPEVGKRVRRRETSMAKAKPTQGDLAADLVKLHLEKPEFNKTYLRKMIMTNFGAGHETLASTLTSIMAMVGSHTDVQGQLQDELRQSHPSRSHSVASRLPYMQAVIKETKRLHPVLGMSLPRRVPSPGVTLHGTFLPPGTTVGCNPVSLHRNPDICGAEPDIFSPQRWLEDEGRAKEMEVYNLAWGGGARSCPGRHLAELIVNKVVVALLDEFDIEVMMPDETVMPSYFLSIMTNVQARFIPKVCR